MPSGDRRVQGICTEGEESQEARKKRREEEIQPLWRLAAGGGWGFEGWVELLTWVWGVGGGYIWVWVEIKQPGDRRF